MQNMQKWRPLGAGAVFRAIASVPLPLTIDASHAPPGHCLLQAAPARVGEESTS